MNNLTTYITEKLKINKHTLILDDSNPYDFICTIIDVDNVCQNPADVKDHIKKWLDKYNVKHVTPLTSPQYKSKKPLSKFKNYIEGRTHIYSYIIQKFTDNKYRDNDLSYYDAKVTIYFANQPGYGIFFTYWDKDNKDKSYGIIFHTP